MNKFLRLIIAVFLVQGILAGCAGKSRRTGSITVISREDGSGTRSAFSELFGVVDENKNDATFRKAEITNNTAAMMSSVAGDKNAIGYISLGSLDNSVKALKINGVNPSQKNIRNGTYVISRPFNIAVKNGLTPAERGFINFILSAEGQQTVEENGYVSLGELSPSGGGKAAGKITVAGSSSMAPLMEKLREAYQKIHPNVDIEIQRSDSSTGASAVINGISGIGMVSRELTKSETDKGLTTFIIAMDGIAVIVNNENPQNGLSKEDVKKIFSGTVKRWDELE
jgi:phosphate transport system substrate-binding protein